MGFHLDLAGSRILPLKFYISKTLLVWARSVSEIHIETSICLWSCQNNLYQSGGGFISCNRKQDFLNLFPVHILLWKKPRSVLSQPLTTAWGALGPACHRSGRNPARRSRRSWSAQPGPCSVSSGRPIALEVGLAAGEGGGLLEVVVMQFFNVFVSWQEESRRRSPKSKSNQP